MEFIDSAIYDNDLHVHVYEWKLEEKYFFRNWKNRCFHSEENTFPLIRCSFMNHDPITRNFSHCFSYLENSELRAGSESIVIVSVFKESKEKSDRTMSVTNDT